eukprot:2767876-Amphidinium_carterae.1
MLSYIAKRLRRLMPDGYTQPLQGPCHSMVTLESRFGLRQVTKIRATDELSESQVNRGCAMPEKVDLMNIDFVCAMARKLHRNMLRSKFHFELSDGSELSGPVSPAWMKGGADSGLPDLQGRVLDLSHAYKQFIVSRSSLQFAGLMVYNPHSGEAEFFLRRVLPFGSASSVLAFN